MHGGGAFPGGVADDSERERSLVRPYARAVRHAESIDTALPLDMLVRTTEGTAGVDRLSEPEHRIVCQLCRESRSVAEVAARLRITTGLASALIRELTDLGLVEIDEPPPGLHHGPSLELMERIVQGLLRLKP